MTAPVIPQVVGRARLRVGFALIVWVAVAVPSAVPAEHFPVSGWDIPRGELYFLPAAGVAWADQPRSAQEWMQLSWPTFRDEEADVRIQDAIDAELALWLKDEWLPNPEFTHIQSDMGRKPGRTVFHNAYHRADASAVCLGALGERCLLYIERGLPRSEKTDPLRAADVVRDDILAAISEGGGHPRVMVLSRSLSRYRSFSPDGPFEPVEILLVDVTYASELNLISPQY